MNPSPFIPPLGTPASAPGGATLAPPGAWPGPAPHANSYGGHTPGPAINHYFPGTGPPAPHAPLPGGGGGVSVDYTGYPSFGQQPSPWNYPGAFQGHTPAAPPPASLGREQATGGWAGPGADAAGASNWGRRPNPPPAYPPGPPAGPAYPPAGPAYPPAGLAYPPANAWGHGPTPAWPPAQPHFTPAAFPADLYGGGGGGGGWGGGGGGGGWGGGGGGGGTPAWPPGFGGPSPAGFGPPPGPPPGAAFGFAGAGGGPPHGAPPGGPPGWPPAAPAPLGRAAEAHGDRISPWSSGPNYGPVLEPFLIRVLNIDLKLNPLLLPPPDDASSEGRDYLKWNMLFPSSHVQRSSDPPHVSWSKGRSEPATFPRVIHLRLVSSAIPYMIEVRAREREHGVTCADVVDSIADNLYRLSGGPEYNALPAHKQRQLGDAYRHNRSREHGVPGGRLGDGMRRLDWLAQDTIWDGVVSNDRLVRQICGDLLPATFQLRSATRFPMTRDEIEEQRVRTDRVASREDEEEREVRERDRQFRMRNRAASRSRAVSRNRNTTTLEEVPDQGDR